MASSPDDMNEPDAQDAADRRRWLRAAEVLGILAFGNIWFIDEDFWRDAFGPDYVSDREGHPGITLWDSPEPLDLSTTIPLLYGSHHPARFAFQVVNLCGEAGHEPDVTHFQPVFGTLTADMNVEDFRDPENATRFGPPARKRLDEFSRQRLRRWLDREIARMRP